MEPDNDMELLPQDVYKRALQVAHDEWVELQNQELRISIQKKRLRQTFIALFPLAYPDSGEPDINSFSLADAVRLVIGGIDRPITAIEMRGKLTDLGFDLAKFDNPLANIHTTMNRMVESGEMIWADIDEKKAMPGPELKQTPSQSPTGTNDWLQNSVQGFLNSINEERK